MSSGTPDSTRSVDEIARSLPAGTVYRPGTEQYATSTSPDNSSFPQRPDAVVRPRTADDVAATVTLARALGLRVGVQATGHGAGSPLGGGLVLVDTSALDAVSIDPQTRTARVGAGRDLVQGPGTGRNPPPARAQRDLADRRRLRLHLQRGSRLAGPPVRPRLGLAARGRVRRRGAGAFTASATTAPTISSARRCGPSAAAPRSASPPSWSSTCSRSATCGPAICSGPPST